MCCNTLRLWEDAFVDGTRSIPVGCVSVADPGFSNYQIGIILQIFCRKLHENERIWTPRAVACVPGAPLDPPLPTIPFLVPEGGLPTPHM